MTDMAKTYGSRIKCGKFIFPHTPERTLGSTTVGSPVLLSILLTILLFILQ